MVGLKSRPAAAIAGFQILRRNQSFGDVAVRHAGAERARVVFAVGAAGGSVEGEGASAVVAAAAAGGVAAESAVVVGAALLVRFGSAERLWVWDLGDAGAGLVLGRHVEEEVVSGEARLPGVLFELLGHLGAELEAAVLLVLRVVLDEEVAALRVELRVELHDRAADREDARLKVEVLGTQFAELAPAEAALDLGFGEEPEGAFGEGVVDVIELLGGDDLERLARDGRRLHPTAGV
jgi:hypothetical protein